MTFKFSCCFAPTLSRQPVENFSICRQATVMLPHAVHLIDHSPDDSTLNRQAVILNFFFSLSTAKTFNENLVDFIPVTLMWEVTGTFDNPYHSILAKFCAFDDRFEFVVWIFVARDNCARTSEITKPNFITKLIWNKKSFHSPDAVVRFHSVKHKIPEVI